MERERERERERENEVLRPLLLRGEPAHINIYSWGPYAMETVFMNFLKCT
jgi:redox-sensitive bicupin YhaK (pirin superfamily)